MGNLESRAARAGEADSAARVADSAAAEGDAASDLGHQQGAESPGPDWAADGWDTRVYLGGRQAEPGAQPAAKCARLWLDAGAGQGRVTVSVVSWIEAMKAKMAAGR